VSEAAGSSACDRPSVASSNVRRWRAGTADGAANRRVQERLDCSRRRVSARVHFRHDRQSQGDDALSIATCW
jgi:hypothetical protein